MAIAALLQARVNEHNRLAKIIYDKLEFLKLYHHAGGAFSEDQAAALKTGEASYQIQIITYLKDTFKHRQMRAILKEYATSKVAAQVTMTPTLETAKGMAKQTAHSYAKLAQMPASDVSQRRRRR